MVHQVELKVPRVEKWPQWVAGFGGTLLLLQMGIFGGWTSPYIAQLTAPDSIIPMTMAEASWVVSLLNLGRLFGAIGGSICVNYVGSKTTIFITSMPLAVSWVLTVMANHVWWLYIARFLGGIGFGMTYSCFSLYLGEIADASIRGALVTLATSGLSLGNLVVCLMGAYLPMRTTSFVSFILCLILMALFLWLPESPHHLVKTKQDEKAKASLLFYKPSCDANSELAALKKFVESYESQSFMSTLREFKTPPIRKAMSLITVLFLYSQMCGLNNILFYMETILRSAHVTVMDPSFVVVIVMCFGIAGSCLSTFLIDRCGRKILMITSCFGVFVALCCLGVGFQLLSHGFDPETTQIFPIIGVFTFHIAVFIGILSVPTSILSEIFPPHVKCYAACFGSIIAGVFAFVSTATYQPLISLMNEQYVYFFYAVILITAVPYTLIFVPETKGKTLQEIQNELLKTG